MIVYQSKRCPEKVSAAHSCFSELEFMGFSLNRSTSLIHFQQIRKNTIGGGENQLRRLQNQLKPEFNTLVQDMVK